MNKAISLNNSKYFEIFAGKRITKKQVYNSDGDVPFYSANVCKPFGFLHHSNIDNFDYGCILWGIDGNFDFNVKRKGDVFGTTDHCGTIRILNDNIMTEYLLYQLELKKHELGFDRTLRASLSNMQRVKIEIPFTGDETIDVKKQKEIMSKYLTIKNIKNHVGAYLSELEGTHLELEDSDLSPSVADVAVSDIFDFPPTNSKITKNYCRENEGNVPVYGCSKSESAVLGRIRDNLGMVKYYQDCITWNRNGSVGYFFVRKGKFATNEDHRTLAVKTQHTEHLDLHYLRYALQNKARALGYNFTNKLGRDKIAKITIRIPITDDETFDIEKQRQIADKYERIHGIRDSIVGNLRSIDEAVVSI